MTATHNPTIRTLFLLTISAVFAQAVAAGVIKEIPVTTSSEGAMMDFIAGQAALDRGDGAEANALLRSAVEHDPGFAYAWYLVGNASFSAEEFSNAINKAKEVSANASEGEQMLIDVNLRFLDNDFDNQLVLAEELVEKYPHSPRAWQNLSGVQAGLNLFEESRRSLERAIEIDPNFVPAYLALANSYLFNTPKDFNKSEQYFKNTIELAPGEDNYYWGLGDAYRAKNQLEDAYVYYTRATMLDPTDSIALTKRGHVGSFLGHYDEARADYDKGIEVAQPANKGFLASYRAFTWLHGDDPATAVDELKQVAARMDQMDLPTEQRTGAKVFALTNAATVCLHEGMYDDAADILEMRASLLRQNADAVGTADYSAIQEANVAYWQGLLAARRGEFDTAKVLAKRNKELVEAQDNPRKMENYSDLMGLIELTQGNFEEAVEYYRGANLNTMYTKYHLALALEGAGETQEAKDLFKEVADWNFNSVGYALVRKDALARGS